MLGYRPSVRRGSVQRHLPKLSGSRAQAAYQRTRRRFGKNVKNTISRALNLSQIIDSIRHSATLVATLPPDIRDQATTSHAIAIRAVFIMAAASTLLAYIVRLPVSSCEYSLDIVLTLSADT